MKETLFMIGGLFIAVGIVYLVTLRLRYLVRSKDVSKNIKTCTVITEEGKRISLPLILPNSPTVEYVKQVLQAVGAYNFARQIVAIEPSKNTGEAIYEIIEPHALIVRIVLQALIGFGIIIVILIKFVHHLAYFSNQTIDQNATDFLSKYVYYIPTLDIVGLALGYATAVELAYALFTDNLDEAVNPLITGLAATVLIIISKISVINIGNAVGIAIAVIALAGLFLIRRHLIKP